VESTIKKTGWARLAGLAGGWLLVVLGLVGLCGAGDARDAAAAGRVGAARLRICLGEAIAGAGAGVVAPGSVEERLSLPTHRVSAMNGAPGGVGVVASADPDAFNTSER